MDYFLRIGEFRTGTEGDVLKTVLGSCIGLCLWDTERKAGGMVHIMLPDGKDEEKKANPGKFAVTAVEALHQALTSGGRGPRKLVAKIAGGAAMFFKPGSENSALAVGRLNHMKVREILARLGVDVVYEHVSGRKGRNISFDCATGVLTIKVQEGRTETG